MAVASTGKSPASTEPTEPKGASVIVTVIQVLRCFTVDEPLQGVTEIAGKVGLHKSSVSRILATLEKEQVVERDTQSRKYRLGLGLLSVAGPLLADLDVRRAALPVLRELTARTGETSALVVWSGSQAVTVEQVPSPQQIKHTTPLGTRYQTAENASVQVFLADLSADDVHTRILGGQPTMSDTSPVAMEALRAELQQVASRGYAVNYGLTSADEVGVASPVCDHRGEVVAAVLIAAPSYRVDRADVGGLGQQALDAATEISRRLGSTGTPQLRRA
ncbi:MAG: IclR family transcriptional regulator [Terracoccus sp.]